MVEGIVKVRRNRNYRSTARQQGHDEKTAEAIVRAGLDAHGLRETELPNLPGSEPRKLAIAAEVRGRTAVSMAWIADRLKMRSAANVSQQLRRMKAG